MRRCAFLFPAMLVLVVTGCSRKSQQQTSGQNGARSPQNVVAVSTVRVQRGDISKNLSITGTLRAREDVVLSAKMMGRVLFIGPDEGQHVHSGQVLIQLDTSELSAQLNQARAALKAAQARLSQLKAGYALQRTQTGTDIDVAKAQLAAAQAQLRQLETSRALTGAETDSGVQQAQTRVAAAQQQLEILRKGAREQERQQAQQAVDAARVQLDDAARTLRRQQQLLASGAVPQATVDQAQTARDLAASHYETVKQQLSLVREGPRTEEIRVAEENLQQAESALQLAKASTQRTSISDEQIAAAKQQVLQAESGLKLAKAGTAKNQVTDEEIKAAAAAVDQARANVQFSTAQLADCTIVSPVNGVIIHRTVDRGEVVAPGTPLYEVVALDTVYFEGTVSEMDIHDIRGGDPVAVQVDSIPGQTFRGTVREVVPAAEVASRTFRVKVSVPQNGMLKPGGFARGQVKVDVHRHCLLVPADAVVRRDGYRAVFVVEGNKAHLRKVEVGLTNDRDAEIVSGLTDDEQVVVAGHDALQDGDTVAPQLRGD